MAASALPQQVTRAIILSAGQGRRLLPFTADRPKCLLDVQGKTVLERQIDNLLAAGIKSITVVTGYAANQVEQLLGDRYDPAHVRCLYNPFFEAADNLASCWMARQQMQGSFILLNGDTLFDLPVLQRLLAAPVRPITLAVDHKASYDSDDMKVTLKGTQLLRVGKTLPLDSVSGESIGMMRFLPEGAALFVDALERVMRTPEALKQWYLSVIDDIASHTDMVYSQSIDGLGWGELDFPEDLKIARQLAADWDATRTAAG